MKSRLKKKFIKNIYNFHNDLLFKQEEFKNLFLDYSPSDISEYDFKNYLQNDLLVKVDRMSMSHGLEVRVPLSDDVINFASKLNIDDLINDKNQKIILRNIIKMNFNDQKLQNIILRSKHGFQFPMSNQLNYYLKNKIIESLKNYKFLNYFHIPEQVVNNLFKNYKKITLTYGCFIVYIYGGKKN